MVDKGRFDVLIPLISVLVGNMFEGTLDVEVMVTDELVEPACKWKGYLKYFAKLLVHITLCC